MEDSWTVKKKIAASFAALVALSAIIGGVAIVATSSIVSHHDTALRELHDLVETVRLEGLVHEQVADSRGYLLTGDPALASNLAGHEARVARLLAELRGNSDDARFLRLVGAIEEANKDHEAASTRVLEAYRASGGVLTGLKDLLRERATKIERLRSAIRATIEEEERSLAEESKATAAGVFAWRTVVAVATLLAILLGIALAAFLTRGLTRELGSAIQNVRNSSTELQAAANQQATASRQQAAATNETTTTLRELAATARQIAESAGRVAEIAAETTGAAQEGDRTIVRAQDALSSIKRQVDQIVSHMLDLGRKSQQVGGILEVINELAEQTNILAINATIEAAGAGDSGRRFAVVADEVRKLAERVGGSTKDIRTLIDEVRTAVNTTVMATEQGTKAVDAGLRQVGEVATAFSRIAGMVETTTEAAREIELSTKQQTTAVEQVNTAMVSVSQAAKETEASASQTLATASQLAGLSKDLNRLVQSGAAS
jgi:methyl-accepting chemotaxis protein